MPTYGRPGIYVHEAFAPLNPANGIPGESLPCLVAAHPQGPAVPTLVSSWAQYTRLYGGYIGPESKYILPYAVNEFFVNGGQALYVLRVSNSDSTPAQLTIDDIASPPAPAVKINALSPGVWANNIYIEVVVRRPQHFDLNIYYPDTQHRVESFPDVSMDPVDSRYCVSQVNSPVAAGSSYIFLDNLITSYVSGVSDLAPIGPTPLASGTDGTIGNVDLAAGAIAGLDLLVNQVLAVNLPGVHNVTTLNTMINWAASNQDKMIICDGPPPDLYAISSPSYPGSVATEYVDIVSAGNPTLTASTYAAVYGPWLLMPDPSSSTPGSSLWMPPGPAVLAQYQLIDINYGPWWAPAGIRAQLKGIIALECKFTNALLDSLNNYHVNVIKDVPGYGPCIFGALTLDVGYQDEFIAVRREVMAIEHDLNNLLLFALFEPNGPTLWQQVSHVCNNYLQGLFQKGAIGGSSQATSYNVVCDESNNSINSAMNGIVNVDIQLALLSSAEFIQLNLSSLTASSS